MAQKSATFRPRSSGDDYDGLMMHKDRKQDDNRKRNAQQPQQRTLTKSHDYTPPGQTFALVAIPTRLKLKSSRDSK
jgi:hypothetical protein